jgi:hypothetical protein
MREEPWGSHQVEARALKWETSEGLTEESGRGVVVKGWVRGRVGGWARWGRRAAGEGRACRSSGRACRRVIRIVWVLLVVCTPGFAAREGVRTEAEDRDRGGRRRFF